MGPGVIAHFFVPMGFSFSANVIPLINTAQKIVTQLTLINDHRTAALFFTFLVESRQETMAAQHKKQKDSKTFKLLGNILMELCYNKFFLRMCKLDCVYL